MSSNFVLVLCVVSFLSAGCVHHDECPISKAAQDAVVAGIAQTFGCKDQGDIRDDIKEFSKLHCEAKAQLVKEIPTGEYSDTMMDCLVLVKRTADLTAIGAPSNWQCTPGATPRALTNDVCKGL